MPRAPGLTFHSNHIGVHNPIKNEICTKCGASFRQKKVRLVHEEKGCPKRLEKDEAASGDGVAMVGVEPSKAHHASPSDPDGAAQNIPDCNSNAATMGSVVESGGGGGEDNKTGAGSVDGQFEGDGAQRSFPSSYRTSWEYGKDWEEPVDGDRPVDRWFKSSSEQDPWTGFQITEGN